MMNRRSIRRWVTRFGPFGALFLIVIGLTGRPPTLVISQVPPDNLYKDQGGFLTYIVFPTHEETLNFDVYGYTYVNKKIVTHNAKLKINQNIPNLTAPSDIVYTSKEIPEKILLKVGKRGLVWEPWKDRLDNMKEFYDYLKTPQHHCAKMKRLGGTLSCSSGYDDDHMDGHKLVCFDKELEFKASRSPSSCLVMSFGIERDTTFDEAVADDMNCEVHMFDISNYDPEWAKEFPHATFYQEGIAEVDMTYRYYLAKSNGLSKAWKKDLIVHNNRLSTIMKEKKLQTRPIHVLKIDIENFEWNVFGKDLVKGKLLDQVGQIAMEVHSMDLDDLKNATDAVQLASLQAKYDVLRQIEAHGFRRVSYWDNVQDKYAFYDRNGTRYETSGEVLYINTNWYNQTFKDRLRLQQGLEFRDFTLGTNIHT
ncbi:unnamed protein product [Meganyctiphanes norvegica]|uniref:Methyltransferase domain-containing protein n=1 Tax=Meganyctiphanes norvegica TaxID=48144 RepID=A0AAV2PMA2_MEGNR